MTLTVSLVSGRATMDQQQWEIQLRLTLSPGSSLQPLGDLEQKKNIRSSEKKWNTYCAGNRISPSSPTVVNFVKFLTSYLSDV